jgi:ubiquinone/menaquinone biosynthesis C-methylase UbiE
MILKSKCDDLKNQNANSLSFKDIQERKKLVNNVKKLPILDVGTGSGWLAIVTAKYFGYPVISIDNDQNYIFMARENAKKYGVEKMINFKKVDATSIPYPNDFFGTVIAYQTLHHTRYPFRVIEEMFRVCKRDGRVIISELNEEGFELFHGEYYEYPEGFIRLYDKKVLNINKLREFLCSISSEISIKESEYTNLIDCVKNVPTKK